MGDLRLGFAAWPQLWSAAAVPHVRNLTGHSGDAVRYRGDFRDSNRVRSFRGRRTVLFSASVRHAVQQCRVRRALSEVRRVLLKCPASRTHAANR
eukprot:3980703-Prymnesium_polylepis.1